MQFKIGTMSCMSRQQSKKNVIHSLWKVPKLQFSSVTTQRWIHLNFGGLTTRNVATVLTPSHCGLNNHISSICCDDKLTAMERRLWVFAIFFASIAACVFGADSQRTGASELTALSGLDTPVSHTTTSTT